MGNSKIGIALLSSAICFAQQNPSFDVASIKPNPSGTEAGFTEDISPAGVFSARNLTLWNLIRFGYGLTDLQIAGAPPWAKTQGFDIQAQPSANAGPVPREQVRKMLQTLLKDRFALKAHNETREIAAYALTVAQSGSKLPPPRQDGPQRSSFGDLDLRSQTMTALCQIFEFELGRPVVDRTGLAGAFAVKLKWDSERARVPDATLPSLFTAVQEQLGLKLDSARAPVETLVIDSVEQPSEN